jgi:hypothetical protein
MTDFFTTVGIHEDSLAEPSHGSVATISEYQRHLNSRWVRARVSVDDQPGTVHVRLSLPRWQRMLTPRWVRRRIVEAVKAGMADATPMGIAVDVAWDERHAD